MTSAEWMGCAHPAGCPADSRLVPRPCPVTCQVTLKGAMNLLLQVLPIVRFSSPSATAGDAWTLVSRYGPAGSYCKRGSMPARQISPDKNVNCHYTTAAFTLSPESWASTCCAGLPGDQALYAVSVRRLIVLHSNFLQTVPRGSALVFD